MLGGTRVCRQCEIVRFRRGNFFSYGLDKGGQASWKAYRADGALGEWNLFFLTRWLRKEARHHRRGASGARPAEDRRHGMPAEAALMEQTGIPHSTCQRGRMVAGRRQGSLA